MYVFIDGVDKTSNVIKNSIKISDELQERINKLQFDVAGFNPVQFKVVEAYDGFPILNSTANSVTLDKDYFVAIQNNLFRANGQVWVALNESDQESATILTVTNDGGNVKLTMDANFANTPAVGELAGIKKFAGNIIDIKDKNIRLLENIQFTIKCLDFTRICDKKLLNDTFEDKDARYLVNDFANTTINKNLIIDAMDYANNAAIQAEWIETGDGDNPTTDTSSFREGSASGVLPWTFSGGTATYTASPITQNVSDMTGVASGQPTKGVLGFWDKPADFSAITSYDIRIGSDSGNYIAFTITPFNNGWGFDNELLLKNGAMTGTPDWTDLKYLAIIVTETASSSIQIDGIRILEEEFFKHYPHVQESAEFEDFRVSRTKPTETFQRITDELGWYWYVDYDRFIHMFPSTTNAAPISVTENSDNFIDLKIKYDVSRLINRQVVEGGTEVSESKYNQIERGNGSKREWITKNKFKNLIVKLDDGTVTDLMEGGTTTTTVIATGHGLSVNDFIVNRTRANAVRKVLTVADPNTFTVDAVTAQTSGDTFSTFVTQVVGVEGLDEDTGNDYMSNFQQKSIRATDTSDTLEEDDFLLFTYNEIIPILVQATDGVSVSNMISTLGHTDGIFDGQKIIDRTIKSRPEASQVAQAVLNKYSNVVITATFKTTQEGLVTGQLINVKDTTSSERDIDQTFVIQKIKSREKAWAENEFTVTASSLLFGIMELLQQLLRASRKIDVDEESVVNNIEDAAEIITIDDVVTSAVDDNKQLETITIADIISEETVFTPPFVWEPDGASVTRWNLFSWG